MINRTWLGVTVAAVLSFSIPAFGAGGLSITNTDSTAYMLILEDAEEKSWEVEIAAGATMTDLCSDCYVAIKGQEDYQYAEGDTQMRIVDGKLVMSGQE